MTRSSCMNNREMKYKRQSSQLLVCSGKSDLVSNQHADGRFIQDNKSRKSKV